MGPTPQSEDILSQLDVLYDLTSGSDSPDDRSAMSGGFHTSSDTSAPRTGHCPEHAEGEQCDSTLQSESLSEVEKRKRGRPVGGALDRNDPNFVESERMKHSRESRVSGQCSLEEMLESPGMFYNPSMPNLVRKQEMPHHRLMVYLKAQGLSNKEVAERTGYNVVTVADVLKQPWARMLLVEELRIAGRDSLQGLLAGKCEDAVYTLVAVMDDKDEKGSTRVQAANSILNRCLGNPTQPLAISQTDDLKALSDAELIAQLQGIVKGGGGPN